MTLNTSLYCYLEKKVIWECLKKTEPQRKRRGEVQGGLTWETLGNSERGKKSMTFFHRWDSRLESHLPSTLLQSLHACSSHVCGCVSVPVCAWMHAFISASDVNLLSVRRMWKDKRNFLESATRQHTERPHKPHGMTTRYTGKLGILTYHSHGPSKCFSS